MIKGKRAVLLYGEKEKTDESDRSDSEVITVGVGLCVSAHLWVWVCMVGLLILPRYHMFCSF